MRNAAMILGLIGGLMALVVGMSIWGWTEFVTNFGMPDGPFGPVQDQDQLRLAGLAVPVLAIAGAGMARARALWGGLLMGASAVGFYQGFGVNAFTLFPMTFIAAAAILALAAGRPDEEKAHF